MNTVILDNHKRTVMAQLPQRVVGVESVLREARYNTISRTVDVTMTYTFEEFYFISPFQIGTELGEGPIYVVRNQTI